MIIVSFTTENGEPQFRMNYGKWNEFVKEWNGNLLPDDVRDLMFFLPIKKMQSQIVISTKITHQGN